MQSSLTTSEKEQLLKLATVAGFQAKSATLPVITASERAGDAPLSFAQQRLWFLAQMEGVSRTYHMFFGCRLKGLLDTIALRRALDRILARHEVLRTVFVSIEGEPRQSVLPEADSRFFLLEDNLRGHASPADQLDRLIVEEVNVPFDLEHGPLIRGRLISEAEEQHVLLITIHHIVSDGWSIDVFMNELSALYNAFVRGQDDPLPRLELQYADYAAWQRKWMAPEVLRAQAEYWRANLSGSPALLELPTDQPRAAQQNYDGDWIPLNIGEELTRNLRELGKRHGVTLFMTLLAGWAALLARLSGQQCVVIGTPAANRTRQELEGLIGCFLNTLALRVDLHNSPSTAELLTRVKEQMLAAQRHQDIPFEQVVEFVRPARSLTQSPLFQTMLSWESSGQDLLKLDGLEVQRVSLECHMKANFDLTLSLAETSSTIVGGIEYARSLFQRSTIDRYIGYFRTLLCAMVANDVRPIDSIPLLTAAEHDQVLLQWNDSAAAYPSDQCAHDLFEEQASKTPEAVAVLCDEAAFTYGELNRRANRLAHYLRELGVAPDQRVAICMQRGWEMMVGLLGVLKAGGAYVPLDPDYPAERLNRVLEDSAPVAVLSEARLQELFMALPGTTPVLDMKAADAAWKQQPETNPERGQLSPNHLAYVIYTSGSTGTPKGVMITHSSLVNCIRSMQHDLTPNSGDVLFAVTTICFDIAALELYLPLTAGASVRLCNQEAAADAVLLERELQRSSTMMQATPSTWRMLLDAGWTGAEDLKVLCGGEALSVDLAKALLSRCASAWNMYGPTETTIWSLMSRLEHLGDRVPIGKPIANTQVYVLDDHCRPVPIGVPGELCIGGAGVARGYLERPELTAERFVANPYGTAGTRMYKTGDLGRWLPDGNIDFMGRNDFQVKVRGYRIELGEIEAWLREHEAVREAVVLAREEEGRGKQLVAYYTSLEGKEEVGAATLRTYLSGKLPQYMVPAAYVRMEKLPLTPNGKLDRKALPAADSMSYASREYEAPQRPLELVIARVWAKLLKLERVGRQDNFFELGGHSLLTLHVVSELKRAGVELTVTDVFKNPTIAALAKCIPNKPSDEDSAVVIRETGTERPLFLVHEFTGSLIYAHALTRFIGSEIPIYGIPPAKLVNAETSVPTLASRMVGIMRSAQRVGPYRVAGWSFGGVFAYEIARQMLQDGEQIEFLGLFDTYCPDPANVPPRAENANLFLINMLQSASSAEKFQQFEELKPEALGMKLETLVQICKERSLLPLRLAELPAEHIQRTIDHMRFLFRIYDRYAARPISIPVHLFCNQEVAADPTSLGWTAVLPETLIHKVAVPGTHLTMMEAGNIEALGRDLTSALKERRRSTDTEWLSVSRASAAV